jgi:hypothetical protein
MSGIGNITASIRGATGSNRTSYSSCATAQVLQEIGTKPGVLDTKAMAAMGLQNSFKDFDVTNVSPAELGLVSKNLYALGLIDKTTANLMISAGTSLDGVGNQTQPNVKMNALDYFAARIDNLRNANVNGNQYGFQVVPDYINTVYVLQNLNDFAKAGQGDSSAASSVKDLTSGSGINTWA